MDLNDFLQMQRELQGYQKDGDPLLFTDPELRAQFITWNVVALTDEVHEALAEVGWKPWATNRDIDVDRFIAEMVDAWHFFMNLLLAAASHEGISVYDLTHRFEEGYKTKHQVNIKRQLDGYDGKKEKCPHCHRDLAETDPLFHYRSDNKDYCTKECADATIAIT